jgi:undecaprenyl diphosphate synthase
MSKKPDPLPQHIAIIMDGNGRWARKRRRPRAYGHRGGTQALERIVRECGKTGIKYLTVYTFSSENWNRPLTEVKALMALMVEMVRKKVSELDKNNVRLWAMGDLDLLPAKTRKALEEGIDQTKDNTGLTLTLALSYGGRAEILHACRRLAQVVQEGALLPEEIDENQFRKYLYCPDLPDPELLIRTGGDQRISNYLLWQIAYTELWITDVLWPDFDISHLRQALSDFKNRERRFGQTGDQVK